MNYDLTACLPAEMPAKSAQAGRGCSIRARSRLCCPLVLPQADRPVVAPEVKLSLAAERAFFHWEVSIHQLHRFSGLASAAVIRQDKGRLDRPETRNEGCTSARH